MSDLLAKAAGLQRDFNRQPLTVAELIELLKQCPQDAPVVSEGCDCDGPATGVDYTRPNYLWPAGQVTIARGVYDAVKVKGL